MNLPDYFAGCLALVLRLRCEKKRILTAALSITRVRRGQPAKQVIFPPNQFRDSSQHAVHVGRSGGIGVAASSICDARYSLPTRISVTNVNPSSINA